MKRQKVLNTNYNMKLIILILACLIIIPQFASSLSITVQVPEKYTDVSPGERFYFQIEVKYPENPKRKDLRLEYTIETIEGELISQSKALKAIETQASFIDFIVIPESTKKGLYVINVKILDYESLSEEISATFNVKGTATNELKLYFFTIIGAVIVVGILIIINIRRARRK